MDKYNLHLLGWKQFEDLCTHVMQHVLNVTYTPFSDGKDGGRDGYYIGEGKLSGEELSGQSVFQCKHTSEINRSFSYSVVSKESSKVKKLVSEIKIKNYVIFTNYKLSSNTQLDVEKKFRDNIQNLDKCLILGSEWLNIIIDSNKILRRLVPRLYGIGDLSEILDERVLKQSVTLLEELKDTVRSFVNTESFKMALTSIINNRFVILLGPPAVGKTAIAVNICMTSLAEQETTNTVILNHPDDFITHWNPDDPKRIFWFDDVFGTTSIDSTLVKAWTLVLPKLNSAIKNGATVIFTSRDYIFNEAQYHFKENDFLLLFNSQVRVNVERLSRNDKERILYNHIRHGDLPKSKKTELKPYLNKLVDHPGFTPELARRLGNTAFHFGLKKISNETLDNFFGKPVPLFDDIIKSLDDDKKASLILILLHGNSLSSPVLNEHMRTELQSAYEITLPRIKKSLEFMKDSLVKLSVISGEKLWSLYHPSMIDSLQSILAKNEEMIELFIGGADIKVLIRDITCIDHSHKLFVPQTLWDMVIHRFDNVHDMDQNLREGLISFLLKEVPNEFISLLHVRNTDLLYKLTVPLDLTWFSVISTFSFAIKMDDLGYINDDLRDKIRSEVRAITISNGDISFIRNEKIKKIVGKWFIQSLASEFAEKSYEIFTQRFDDEFENFSTDDDPKAYFSEWFGDIDKFKIELSILDLVDDDLLNQLNEIVESAFQKISDFNMIAQYENYGDSLDDDYWGTNKSNSDSISYDIFSDVDT